MDTHLLHTPTTLITHTDTLVRAITMNATPRCSPILHPVVHHLCTTCSPFLLHPRPYTVNTCVPEPTQCIQFSSQAMPGCVLLLLFSVSQHRYGRLFCRSFVCNISGLCAPCHTSFLSSCILSSSLVSYMLNHLYFAINECWVCLYVNRYSIRPICMTSSELKYYPKNVP